MLPAQSTIIARSWKSRRRWCLPAKMPSVPALRILPSAMMQEHPAMGVTTRMRKMGAELIRIRPDLDGGPLAAEICLVMFEECRLGPTWTSKHAPEGAIPRSVEMLADSSAQIIEHDDTLVLVLPARPPAAT